jgi:hypothetical protein
VKLGGKDRDVKKVFMNLLPFSQQVCRHLHVLAMLAFSAAIAQRKMLTVLKVNANVNLALLAKRAIAIILMSVKKATLMDAIDMLTVLTWKEVTNVFVKMGLQMPIPIFLEETVNRLTSVSSGLTIVTKQLKFV